MKYVVHLFCLILILLFTVGCSIQSLANQYLMDSLQSSQNSIQQSPNYQVVEKALPTFIVLVDSMVHQEPTNDKLLLKAAEMHTSYALSFVESQDTRWAGLHYKTAIDYMKRAMQIQYALSADSMIGKPEKEWEQTLSSMSMESVPYLFWWGMSWGLWINVNKDNIKAIGEFPYVRLIMERVLALDPGYQNGLPHLFFGVYYAGIPESLGGKPEEGKKHFERILEITQNEFLVAKVMYARTYAVNTQNRKLFETLLQDVIAAPAPAKALFTMGNEIAKRDAQALLHKIDEYFIPEKEETKIDDGL